MLSVAIIAKDAASTLDQCLSSVQPLAGEIVIFIDSRTTDNTKDIAEKFHSKILTGQFTNFSDLRNNLDRHCTGDWILHIDSDEWLSQPLISEIREVLKQPQFAVYRIPRLNKIFSRFILHTNWDPDGLIRLYRPKRFTWSGLVHSQLQANTLVGRLKFPIYHLNYSNVEQFMTRMNAYTSQESEAYSSFSPVRFFLDPVKDFFRRFIWHLGFLDKWHGFFLSYLMFIYYLELWVKVWQKHQKSSSPA